MNDAKLMDCVIRCTNLAKTYREGELVTPVFEGLELSVARHRHHVDDGGGAQLDSPSIGVEGSRSRLVVWPL